MIWIRCVAGGGLRGTLGCDELKMDAWGADVMVAACQRG